MFKRYRFVVALVLCLCVFAYDTVSISSDLGGRSFAWAGEPAFNGTALRLSSKLGLYFYLKDAVNGGKMTFTINNDATNKQELTFNGSATDDGSIIQGTDGFFGFRCDTTSIQMADTIEATFTYNTNSEVKNNGENAIKSVKAYLDKLVDTEPYKAEGSYTNLKALVNAIRDYGHYAQVTLKDTNSGYDKTHTQMTPNNASLGTTASGLSANDAIKIYDGDTTTGNTTTNKPKVSFTLDLDSNTVLRIYLPTGSKLRKKNGGTGEASVTDITAVAGSVNSRANNAAYTITTTNVTAKEVDDNNDNTNDAFEIAFSNISAHQLGDKFTIPVTIPATTGETTGNGTGNETDSTSYTIVVSPMSYVYAVTQLTYTDDMKTSMRLDDNNELTQFKQAVVALYEYYDKTLAYRNSTEYTAQ